MSKKIKGKVKGILPNRSTILGGDFRKPKKQKTQKELRRRRKKETDDFLKDASIAFQGKEVTSTDFMRHAKNENIHITEKTIVASLKKSKAFTRRRLTTKESNKYARKYKQKHKPKYAYRTNKRAAETGMQMTKTQRLRTKGASKTRKRDILKEALGSEPPNLNAQKRRRKKTKKQKTQNILFSKKALTEMKKRRTAYVKKIRAEGKTTRANKAEKGFAAFLTRQAKKRKKINAERKEDGKPPIKGHTPKWIKQKGPVGDLHGDWVRRERAQAFAIEKRERKKQTRKRMRDGGRNKPASFWDIAEK